MGLYYSSVLIILSTFSAFKFVESQDQQALDVLQRQLYECDVEDIASRNGDYCNQHNVYSCIDAYEYLDASDVELFSANIGRVLALIDWCLGTFEPNRKLTECIDGVYTCARNN